MDALANERPVSREATINIRAQPQAVALIDEAARALGKTRSSFVMETATREAECVLLDKRLFNVDQATYDRFLARLDAPPGDNPRLRKLLHTKAPWEK
jgi:uncharacterized protein (DUF1778 family)